jgi:hypothetical protein
MLQKPLFWLSICVLISSAVLAYPLYVIQPFRFQGPRELAFSLALIRFRPIIEIALLGAALTLCWFSWHQARGALRKAAASACALIVVVFAVLSHINVYELMFHPIDRPTFSPAAGAKLDGGEEVIAVHIGTAARAYPVRSMSYHHIVNDMLGGLPIVATY